MSVVYLLLGGDRHSYISGIITPAGFHVFSIYDFLQVVLVRGTGPRKNRKYVQKLWKDICRCNPHFMEVPGTLDLAVPTPKMTKMKPTAGTTVAGLKGVLDVLGSNVTDATRAALEDIFARYGAGDRSMVVWVNLNDKSYPQIPRFSYNFRPSII
jgi:hypothetical protein